MSGYASWLEEKQSAWLYRELAACEPEARIAALYRALADSADAQAGRWQSTADAPRVLTVAARADHGDTGAAPRPASRAPDARGDEGARPVRLRRPATHTRPSDAHLGRRGGRASPRIRRREPARGGVRRERWAGVEREPDHGRGRRGRRPAVRRHGRCRRPACRGALDGGGRVCFGALAARDVSSTRSVSSATSWTSIRKKKPRSWH